MSNGKIFPPVTSRDLYFLLDITFGRNSHIPQELQLEMTQSLCVWRQLFLTHTDPAVFFLFGQFNYRASKEEIQEEKQKCLSYVGAFHLTMAKELVSLKYTVNLDALYTCL